MSVGTAAAPAPDRRQAAVNDAASHLYDAEVALHIARQTGVGSWISAACDRLHEAVEDHTAAVDALEGCNRAVPPAYRASRSPAARESGGMALVTAPGPGRPQAHAARRVARRVSQ